MNEVITKETIKRLVKDVREIVNNPLTQHGIHYIHDDTNMLKGQALIIGPSETPYENGYYLFDIDYPSNYPHSPPKFTYYTNDGVTRFNPNLYKSGKVCISILNTWQGEQWTACLTISTTLLAICTTLNNNPLLNEPGVGKEHKDINKYTKIIEYKNYEVAICDMICNKNIKKNFKGLHHIMKENFIKNYNDIMKTFESRKIKTQILSTGLYSMTSKIDYDTTEERLKSIYEKLK
jgi:ubiquitin-conjugating enzyme E2 Z